MQKLLFSMMCLLALMFFSCGGNSKDANIPKNSPAKPLLDLQQLTDQKHLEQLFGVPKERNPHDDKYPCKKQKCKKLIFQNGHEAILDKDGNVRWLWLNGIKEKLDDGAIERILGIKYTNPDVKNEFIQRWNNNNGWAIDINGAEGNTTFILCKKLTEEQITQIECEKNFMKNISSWDGSHMGIVVAVQQSMNDPDSFEHVKTTYGEHKKGGFIVSMAYRGNNSFGAKILTSIDIRVGCDGSMKVIE